MRAPLRSGSQRQTLVLDSFRFVATAEAIEAISIPKDTHDGLGGTGERFRRCESSVEQSTREKKKNTVVVKVGLSVQSKLHSVVWWWANLTRENLRH